MKDTHFVAEMSGEINLQQAKAAYLLEGKIGHADLAKLHWGSEDVQIKTGFDLNIKFTDIDDLFGKAVFTDIVIKKPKMDDLSMGLISFTANENNVDSGSTV